MVTGVDLLLLVCVVWTAHAWAWSVPRQGSKYVWKPLDCLFHGLLPLVEPSSALDAFWVSNKSSGYTQLYLSDDWSSISAYLNWVSLYFTSHSKVTTHSPSRPPQIEFAFKTNFEEQNVPCKPNSNKYTQEHRSSYPPKDSVDSAWN